MAEKAIQIAPKSDAKIKARVSRKLNKKSPIVDNQESNPISAALISITGIFAIFPAVIYGTFTFFGAGFKYGLDATVKMYNELVEDSKRLVM